MAGLKEGAGANMPDLHRFIPRHMLGAGSLNKYARRTEIAQVRELEAMDHLSVTARDERCVELGQIYVVPAMFGWRWRDLYDIVSTNDTLHNVDNGTPHWLLIIRKFEFHEFCASRYYIQGCHLAFFVPQG